MSSSSEQFDDRANISFVDYVESLRIPYEKIKLATNNFSEANLIPIQSPSSSSFQKLIYKGQLKQSGGQLIDIVARIVLEAQDNIVFNELLTSYLLTHKNILSVFKISGTDEPIIINKYEVNESLDKHLSDSNLTWMQRLHICVGVAHALSYIHDFDADGDFSVIHGNVKSSKILLDENWEPKLTCFGFSMFVKKHQSHLTSKYSGTLQYTDPAYVKEKLIDKYDVFSFGVVLFEVLFEEIASVKDEDNWYFAKLAKSIYKENALNNKIRSDLHNQMNLQSLDIFSETAFSCLEEESSRRPNMVEIVKKLEASLELQHNHESLMNFESNTDEAPVKDNIIVDHAPTVPETEELSIVMADAEGTSSSQEQVIKPTNQPNDEQDTSPMEIDRSSEILNLSNELIYHAYHLSIEAHKHNHPYFTNTTKIHDVGSASSVEVQIFAFKGSWEVDDWYHDDHFGQTDVDQILFPSLRRIGQNRLAKVNKAMLQRSQDILNNPVFKSEVERAVVVEKKKIWFAGHSYGGALASFVTLSILDEYKRKPHLKFPIGCVTFGSPLIGDGTVSHAVRREKWTGHFTHFVMEHDIVPRIMLAPHISIQKHLPEILQDFRKHVNPTNQNPNKIARLFSDKARDQTADIDQLVKHDVAAAFFESVLINASIVASHDVFDLMEPTSTLMKKLSADFVKVSPYRPFGSYVFCTRDESQTPDEPRQQLVVDNPNAVLQLLFYFLQLPNENQDLAEFAVNSLAKSLGYEEELNNNGMQLQNMVYLKDLNEKLWTSNGTTDDVVRTSSKALFELTPSAKWCLMAGEEAEMRKKDNVEWLKESMRAYQTESTRPNQKSIEDILDIIHKYKVTHDNGNEDYYEAFKLQDKEDDFVANVNRLELAKIYDVVIEMVMCNDLPDEFEAWDEFIVLGTKFRRLVEPLDIANFYRHLKGKCYMNFRPKKYKFMQRWYEHAHMMGFESISESNFVAEVEELKKEVEPPEEKKEFETPKKKIKIEITPKKIEVETSKKTREQVKEGVENIKNLVEKWKSDDKIENDDVFWGYSILSKLQEELA